MLSHHRFLFFLGFLLIPLCIAGFMLFQRSHVCIYKDKMFCSFVKELDIRSFEGTHGSFISQTGEKASQVNWSLERHKKHIQVNTEGRESLNMIVIDNTVYVKDYRDGLWWKQSKKDMEQYVSELAFDPEVFLMAIIDYIDNPKSVIGKYEEVECGSNTCWEYTLSDDGFKTKVYVGIDIQSNRLVRYAGKKEESTVAFNVIYKKKPIEAPSSTKDAQKGQNVFMDQLISSPHEQKASDLDFVKEFSEQMKQGK